MERPNSSFFALTPDERRGILSLAVRMRGVRNGALALLLPACVLAPLTYGPNVIIFVALIVVGFAVLGLRLQRPKRLELPLIGALLWAQVMLAGMIAVASRYQLDGIGLLILPAAGSCLLLPRRLAALFVGWSTVFIVGVGFAIDTQGVLDTPPTLFLPIGVLLCVSLPAIMVRQLEVESHDTAMTDPLTGALNRVALELRLTELGEQSAGLPLRVGVVMADLDHFKMVNDELGHAVGDVVLQETVKRMRGGLGPLTPIYRAGGEEFVALIAGADTESITAIGERLRLAVRAEVIEDRTCTVSIGVAASTLDLFSPKALLELAD
ncbi:MAG: GGDEF domain-containing protein, partial [Solirubrobacteraceae bacterium]|nr:GGDEF domain-containing protein [Solirubrobacteraceae bacterium]